MRFNPRRPLFASIILFSALNMPVLAQDVQYTTVSKMDLGSVINALARLGGGLEVKQNTYIQGGRMRTDVDRNSSTIMDFENGRYIWLDHQAKTYSVMTLEQMIVNTERAAQQVRASQAGAAASDNQSSTLRTDSGEVKLDFKLAVDRTNETQKVNGWTAQRALVTMTTNAKVKPEGEKEQEAGSLVVFIDMWVSRDVPAHDATQRLYANAQAKRYMGEAGNAVQSIGAAFASDPQMAEALRKAGEEMQKIEGVAVKTTTYLVGVPPNRNFDRDLILAPKKKSGGVMGALGRAATRGQQQQEKADAAPEQKTAMTFVSELRDVKTATLPASLFEPPAGYTRVDPHTGK